MALGLKPVWVVFAFFSFSLVAEATPLPGQLIVKLKARSFAQKDADAFENIIFDLKNKIKKTGQKSFFFGEISFESFSTRSDFSLFKMNPESTDQVLLLLKKDPRVQYAEPNYLYQSADPVGSESIPSDPEFAKLWALRNYGQSDLRGQVGKVGADLRVPRVWSEGYTGNKNIKVSIIDTGIDQTHPDLTANVDPALGWNFITDTADTKDLTGHGTHCAGIIGATANNRMGVVGVNWNVTLMPMKFLGELGGSTVDSIKAIQLSVQKGAKIINASWGGYEYSQALYDAIAEARSKGVLLVAAAGNLSANNDEVPYYPASYLLDNVVSVGATDNRDHLAEFSNYGMNRVDLAAPGVSILSTIPGEAYASKSGTSMAAPYVSGVAALLWSVYPSWTYRQIKQRLIDSSDFVRSLKKKILSRGRVNAYNAVHGIFPKEEAPTEGQWVDVNRTIESPHPYENNTTYPYLISVPRARFIRVVFYSVDTEENYDWITLKDADGEVIDQVSGAKTNYVTDYVAGMTATVTLVSDASGTRSGFKIAKIQAVF